MGYRRARRAGHVLAGIVASVAALVVLVVALLQVRPLRETILDRALARADASLPGVLHVGDAAWPEFSRLDLRDFTWIDGIDTLATADRVLLDFDVLPLAQKDVVVREIAAVRLKADVPAIQLRFPPNADTTQPRETARGRRGFPRDGSIPGVPSVRIDRFDLDAPVLRIAPGRTIRGLRAIGAFDGSQSARPNAVVDTLTFVHPEGDLALERLHIRWSLDGGGVLEASGSGRLGTDFPFTLEGRTEPSGEYGVTLLRGGDAPPPAGVGLQLSGRFHREGNQLKEVEAHLLLKTPNSRDLSSIPALAERARSLPAMDGLIVRGDGIATFRPSNQGNFTILLEPNGWVEEGKFVFAYGPEGIAADVSALRLDGILLTGHWRKRGHEQDGAVIAEVRGTRWARPFVDPSSLPDSLVMDLNATLRGTTGDLRAQAEARGGMRRQGVRIRQIGMAASARLGDALEADVGFTARLDQLIIAGSGRVERGKNESLIRARISPLRLIDGAGSREVAAAAAATPRPGIEGDAAYVTFEPADASLTIEGFRFIGSFGGGRIDGGFRKDAGGEFRLAAAWPDPPAALMRRLNMTPEAAADLTRRWRDGVAYNLGATAVATRQRDGFAVRMDADMTLPGPRTWAPILPIGSQVEDLGEIRGSVRGAIDPVPGGSILQFGLDMGRTAWMDRFVVRGSREGTRMQLDTLDVAIQGFDARGGASVSGERLSGAFIITLRDERLLRRFVPALRDSVDAGIEGRLDLAGTQASPAWSAAMDGHLLSRPVDLPEIVLRASSPGPGRIGASLRAGNGVRLGMILLDSVKVNAAQLPEGELPRLPADETASPGKGFAGRVSIEARGTDLDYAHAFNFRPGGGMLIITDSLRIRIDEQDLRAREPFLVHLLEGDGGVLLRGLDLEGSLGTIRGEGVYGKSLVDLDVDANLDLPENQPSWLSVPSGLWPSRVRLDLRAHSGDTLLVDVVAEDLNIGTRESVDARARISGLADRIEARLRLDSGDDALLDAAAVFAGSLTLAPFRFVSRDGELAAQAVLRRFPLPAAPGNPMAAPGYLDRGEQEKEPVLDALMTIRGSTASPALTAGGAITFPGYGELENYRVSLQARLLPDGAEPAPSERQGEAEGLWDSQGSMRITHAPGYPDTLIVEDVGNLPQLPDPRPGMSARIHATRGDREVMTADLALPMRFSLSPAAAGVLSEKPMTFRAVADRVELEEIRQLVPRMDRLGGKLHFTVSADGPARGPELKGDLVLDDVSFLMDDGSRASFHGKADLSGNVAHPVVRGRVTVDNGTIKIPETPKYLHPTDGTALLWRRRTVASASPGSGEELVAPEEGQLKDEESTESSAALAEVDSLAGRMQARAEADSAATPAGTGQTLMKDVDLSVRLDIPSGVWIEGRGLEVSLTGDVEISQRGGIPVLLGSLRAGDGKMEFQGRKLDIESGTVTFYGGREFNPSLDLVLVKEEDDTRAEVHITGTLERPNLALSSDPEMAQSDIFSFIIFGKKKENLSPEESQRLDERALATAEQFAAGQFASRLSREIGLDVLQYDQARQDSLGRAVTVGKYISPNLLVKYQQTLTQEKAFEIIIQYWIGKGWRLETHGGRMTQSGVDLQWGQDF